jgi:hypothetical protein
MVKEPRTDIDAIEKGFFFVSGKRAEIHEEAIGSFLH